MHEHPFDRPPPEGPCPSTAGAGGAPTADGDDGVVGGSAAVAEALARALGVLASEDVAGLPGPAAGDEAVMLLGVAEAVRVEALRRLGRFDAEGAWAGQGATSTSAWLAGQVPLPAGEVRSLVATVRVARRHARVGEALRSGAVSLGAVRLLAQAVTPEREALFARDVDVLVDAAEGLALRDLARVTRAWRALADDELADEELADDHDHRWATASAYGSGRVHFEGDLDAVEGAGLLAALDDLMAPDPAGVADGPRTARQRRADAFAQLARRHLASRNAGASGDAAPVAGVEVHVGLEDLLDGLDVEPTAVGAPDGGGGAPGPVAPEPSRAAGRAAEGPTPPHEQCQGDGATFDPERACCEVGHLGPVPRGVARRLCCDAWVGRVVEAPAAEAVAVLLGPDGPLAGLRDTPLGRTLLAAPSAPLDLGRRRRTFTPAQRRAVAARDRHCAFPGCDRPPDWCDVHHVDPWDDGGPTDTANGALLCSHHHTVVHLRRWRPVRGPDGRWSFTPPTHVRSRSRHQARRTRAGPTSG